MSQILKQRRSTTKDQREDKDDSSNNRVEAEHGWDGRQHELEHDDHKAAKWDIDIRKCRGSGWSHVRRMGCGLMERWERDFPARLSGTFLV